MYVNNISERSSSRVLQQPGGRQSHNIFGGDDQPEPVQRGGRRGVQQPSSIGQPPAQQLEPVAETSSNAPQVAAGQRKSEDERPVQRQARAVNNIWGGDDDVQQKPSTRVNSRPGGDSNGVAGALSSTDNGAPQIRASAARANMTSANSPFSSDPMPVVESKAAANRAKQAAEEANQPAPVRSSTRVMHAPGGQSSNILSWQ